MSTQGKLRLMMTDLCNVEFQSCLQVIHLAFPKAADDVFFRAWQHIYFVPVVSLLFASWRMQSLQHAWSESFDQSTNGAIRRLARMELALMAVNYAYLAWLGPLVAIGSILLSGLLVALIVTATHQSEEIIDHPVQQDGKQQLPDDYSFVECQFATTRDVVTDNPIVSWLWGGMQYVSRLKMQMRKCWDLRAHSTLMCPCNRLTLSSLSSCSTATHSPLVPHNAEVLLRGSHEARACLCGGERTRLQGRHRRRDHGAKLPHTQALRGTNAASCRTSHACHGHRCRCGRQCQGRHTERPEVIVLAVRTARFA